MPPMPAPSVKILIYKKYWRKNWILMSFSEYLLNVAPQLGFHPHNFYNLKNTKRFLCP